MAYMSFESNRFPFITHPYSPDPRIFLKKIEFGKTSFGINSNTSSIFPNLDLINHCFLTKIQLSSLSEDSDRGSD